ncbi:MAG: DUF433 domain-containing protein [SAR202 cluster bacterium]|nr:DUF433 domain-containing protein [SAR202 cluster bacterium]
MATLMNRITVNPKQCGGRPCIRGMRIRVKDVLAEEKALIDWARGSLEAEEMAAEDESLSPFKPEDL